MKLFDWRKSITLLIIALFVISLIPAVIAEETADDEEDLELDGDLKFKKSDRWDKRWEKRAERLEKKQGRVDKRLERVDGRLERFDDRKEQREFMQEHRGEFLDAFDPGQPEEALDLCMDTCGGVDTFEAAECEVMCERHMKQLENPEEKPGLGKRGPFMQGMPEEFPGKGNDRARGNFEKAKKNYMLARQHYLEARKNYLGQKEHLHGLRKDIRECKDVESEECQEKRKEFTQESQEFLLNTADVVEEAMNKVKHRIEMSTDMTEEEKEKMLALLEERLAEVKEAFEKVKNMGETTDHSEVREAAQTIKGNMKDTRMMLKRGVGKLVEAKLGNLVHRMEKVAEKFEKKRDQLAEKGKDVSALDEALQEYNNNVGLAKDLYLDAKQKFQDAKESGNEEGVREAHELLKKARHYLKEARENLKDVVQSIRKASNGSGPVELDEPTPAPEEESTEEEEDTVDVGESVVEPIVEESGEETLTTA